MPRYKTRTYEYAEAKFDSDAAMKISGLDYLRGIGTGQVGTPPAMGATLGIPLPCELENGRAVIETEVGDFVMNPLGVVHGGFAATLLDSVMGIAIHTTLEPGVGYTTAELKVNLTRAIMPGAGRLRADGKIIHRGRQMATAEGRITGIDDNKLYAHGVTTCLLFPLKNQKD